jgi:hypothetical protein
MDGLALASIWISLGVGSAVYLGYLGNRLFKKAKSAYEVSKPLIAKATALADAVNTKATYERPNDNLLDDVNVHLIERAKLVKSRELAAERRQRRLIARLENIENQESELKNGRT